MKKLFIILTLLLIFILASSNNIFCKEDKISLSDCQIDLIKTIETTSYRWEEGGNKAYITKYNDINRRFFAIILSVTKPDKSTFCFASKDAYITTLDNNINPCIAGAILSSIPDDLNEITFKSENKKNPFFELKASKKFNNKFFLALVFRKKTPGYIYVLDQPTELIITSEPNEEPLPSTTP